MRIEDVNSRRDYVKMVRGTFDHPQESAHLAKQQDTKEGEAECFSFLKVRMLLALFIFIAFVLCDQTNTDFYQYSTKDIVSYIEQNYDYTNLEKYAMMITSHNFSIDE